MANGTNDYKWWLGTNGHIYTNTYGIGVEDRGLATGALSGELGQLQDRGDMFVSYGNGGYQGFSAGARIDDPVNQKPTANDSSNYSYGGSYSSGSGSSATKTSYNPAQVAQYDQGISQYETSLNRLPNQLKIAQDNLEKQYGIKNNELDTSYGQAQQTYKNSGVQNQQQLRNNYNTIIDQSAQGLRGLMRTLGAHNALGSSDMLNAPQAVQNAATAQNNGAGYNYATNQQNLDTNWGTFDNEMTNKRKQLNDWKKQQLDSILAQSKSTEQSLNNNLASLKSQRAAYLNGNATAAAQPYLDKANALSTEIDNLGRINPTYTGTTATYTAPALSTYNTGNGVNINAGTPNGYEGTNALSGLLLLARKKQQANY